MLHKFPRDVVLFKFEGNPACVKSRFLVYKSAVLHTTSSEHSYHDTNMPNMPSAPFHVIHNAPVIRLLTMGFLFEDGQQRHPLTPEVQHIMTSEHSYH